MAFDIGNGLSALGGAVSQTAGAAALEQQKAALDEERLRLANELQEGRESRLETQRQTGQQTLQKGQQEFLGGQQTASFEHENEIEKGRQGSSERIASGNRAVQRESLVPGEVRTAEWLAKATPEQRAAYRESLAVRSGMPAWATEQGGTPTGEAPPVGGKGGKVDKAASVNPDALTKLPSSAQSIVKAMVEGRISPPTSFAMAKPYWQSMLAAASAYDPSFDQTTWGSRVATRKDFTSGQAAKAVTAMNTALGHAGVLMENFEKMDNFGGMATPLNGPKNWLAKQMGDERVTNAQVDIGALASEARKVFAAAGGGNLTELKDWEKNFPLNGSPAQQKGALQQFVNLLDSRLGALATQYNRGMGKSSEPLSLLDPHAREVYQLLTGEEPKNATGYQLGAPTELPAANKRVAGETEWINPNGVRMLWTEHGWEPKH
jgi:hypothetical protein